MAKQDYNRANRRYRKYRIDDDKKEMVDKFDTYKEMCKYVQERSWRQWVEECNFDISTTELWRRLRICTGVSQRPPTHPNAVDKAEQLCQQFVMRSDPLNINAATKNILDTLHPQRETMIHRSSYKF